MTIRATELFAFLLVVALPLTGSAATTVALREAAADGPVLRFLEERVRQDPLDFPAWNRLAVACVRRMRETGDLAWLERAARAAKASLAAVPETLNPGGLAALALTELESHRFTEALSSAERAFAIDPRDTSALATAGDAQMELGNYSEAADIYDRLSAEAESPPLLARRARLAELRGDDDLALELLARAGNEDGWYRLRRGEMAFRRGRFEEAEAEYLAAPDTFAKADHLAELRAAQGRTDEAIAAYRDLIAQVERPELLHALGDLLAFTGDAAGAREYRERALAGYLASVARGDAHYFHHLAGYYSDSEEDPSEALRWARRDIEVRHSVYAWDALAWALYKTGDIHAAADAAARALAVGTRDAHLYYHAGLIFSRAGDLVRGRELLRRVFVIHPAYGGFHVHR